MIHKLPGWVWFGAAVRSYLAGISGAVMFSKFSSGTLSFPAALTGLVGLTYSVYRDNELSRPEPPPMGTDL